MKAPLVARVLLTRTFNSQAAAVGVFACQMSDLVSDTLATICVFTAWLSVHLYPRLPQLPLAAWFCLLGFAAVCCLAYEHNSTNIEGTSVDRLRPATAASYPFSAANSSSLSEALLGRLTVGISTGELLSSLSVVALLR